MLDISTYNPSPEYLRALIKQSGLTQREVCRRLGIKHSTMRDWLAGKSKHSYPVQYCIEQLARPQQ